MIPYTSLRPNAPVNLSSSNVKATSLDLSWDDVSQADGYAVYKDGAKVADVSTSTYSVTGLTSGTTYEFYVVVTNKQGKSYSSETITETTT